MYKIILDDKIIDVIKQPTFIRFLQHEHIVFTNQTLAHGVIGSDSRTVYSFDPKYSQKFPVVKIAEVESEMEFKRLQSLLNSGKETSVEESALEKAKETKIASLSSLCKNKIIAGFTLTLSDGNTYSFKLTEEDQINLMSLEHQLNSENNVFIYHANNQPCAVYSREDIIRIIKAYKAHVLYHTTYFNTAKHYLKSFTDIEQVNLFQYGMDVSESVNNVIIKQILKNGEGIYQ